MQFQPPIKLTLRILASCTNRTKCLNTTCSTKQNSNFSLANHKNKLDINHKTCSISTKPNICFTKKLKFISLIKCWLPLIEKEDNSSKCVIVLKKKYHKGLYNAHLFKEAVYYIYKSLTKGIGIIIY